MYINTNSEYLQVRLLFTHVYQMSREVTVKKSSKYFYIPYINLGCPQNLGKDYKPPSRQLIDLKFEIYNPKFVS